MAIGGRLRFFLFAALGLLAAVAPGGCAPPRAAIRAGRLAERAGRLAAAGDYRAALAPAEQARALLEQALGPADPRTATAVYELGKLQRELGELEQARALLERALALRRAALGADDPKVADVHQFLGMVLMASGDYEGARRHLERGLAIRWQALGPDAPVVAFSLKILGRLMIERGDLLAARGLLDQALAIQQRSLGPEHPFVAETLNLLGPLLAELGDAAGARQSLRRALAIRERALGPAHPAVAESLAALGRLLASQGDHPRAAGMFARALELERARLGEDHPQVAELESRLGFERLALPGQQGARGLLERAVGSLERSLGPKHLELADALRRLALCHWLQGDERQARELHHRAALIVQSILIPLFDATSERERIALIHFRRVYFDEFLSLFDRPADAGLVYEAVLRWKGVVARTFDVQVAAARSGDDAGQAALVERLGQVRRELAWLTFAAPGAGPESQRLRRARLAALTRAKDDLERELAEAGRLFEQQERLTARHLPAVCARLGPDQALVDFFRYRRLERPDPAAPGPPGHRARYLAFVLAGADCRPQRIELGPAADLERDADLYRRLIRAQASPGRLARVGRRLRRRLWDPLRAALAGRPFVWVVPDGPLGAVPLAALPEDDGSYLVEHLTLRYLSSARQLARPAPDGPRPARGALVVGGIDYGRPAAPGPGLPSPAPGTPWTAPGLSSSAGGPAAVLPVGPLPDSLAEARAVARTLRRAGADLRPTLLTGPEASEQRVVEQMAGRRLVHLATHAFFAGPPDPGSGRPAVGLINPLLLSGLVLAGANRRPAAGGHQDGLLTAEEVAALDLRGIRLVVLSACGTGRGEVLAGEGVLGLRRAFAQAGVRALVMSLWAVPDRDTRLLMEDFYQRVAERPDGDQARALRAAQLAAIARRRQEGRPADPRAWGAFVISGR